MDITIRKAIKEDYSEILAMIKIHAEIEDGVEFITTSEKQMEAEKDYFDCFVAENENNEIVGMAMYFFAYYSWVGKSLYLEDIFVKKEYRGHKIGTQLLGKIFDVAKEERCNRIRLSVYNTNTDAAAFYKKFGAEIDNGWSNCSFDAKAINEFKLQ